MKGRDLSIFIQALLEFVKCKGVKLVGKSPNTHEMDAFSCISRPP